MPKNLANKLTFIFLFFSTNYGYSQYSIPEESITVAALIQAGMSSGSGFFIQDTTEVFFVTARHVIISEAIDPVLKKKNYQLISPTIEVRWYARQAEKSNSNLMVIDLVKLNNSSNLKFGQLDQDDYAIMRIGKIEKREDFSAIIYSSAVSRQGASSMLNGFPLEQHSTFNQIGIGNDVFMIGYPKSLGLKEIPQYDFNRPLVRKGIVAGKDVSKNNVIIDCPSYQGNSGGIIYEVKDNELKVIGIVSSFIPFAEVWTSQNYGMRNVEIANSGYSVIIPVEKALEQIKSIRKSKFQ